MSLRRPRTKRAIRHTDQTDLQHTIDKAQGEARRRVAFVRYELPLHDLAERDLSGLAPWAFRRDANGKFLTCTRVGEYADYAEAEKKARGWFRDKVIRNGIEHHMRRKVEIPLHYAVVSAPPWFSGKLADMLKSGDDPRPQLRNVVARWMRSIATLLEGKRFWLGISCHTDTSDLHFDLLLSRHDGKGTRIGAPGLQLVGPWMVGVDRQIRACAVIDPSKQKLYRRHLEKHEARYGEGTVPLDIALARALDAAAEAEMPELGQSREAYGRSVPSLERAHKLRAAKQAQAAAHRLSDPAPDFDSIHDEIP